MASLRSRVRKDGTTFTSVLFRENGKQTSKSFGDHKHAIRFKKLLDQVGATEARRIFGFEEEAAAEVLTLEQWLNQHVDALTGVEPATQSRYRTYITADIAPVIGELPLAAVNEAAVSMWLGTLKGSGKTVANKHGFLAGALNAAVRTGKLASNPCIHSRLPKTQREEMVFLSPADFRAINDELTADWRPLATWLVCSGMRFSEATALRVGDIDSKANTARVSRAWKYTADGSERIGPPKSKAGTRTIDVPPEAIAVLDLKRPRAELLFANGKGKRIRSTVFFEQWESARTKAALGVMPRVHDLRHTCASWQIAAGVPLPVIQRHMGHESITTTIDTYGHLDRTSAKAAASAISAAMSV